MWSVPYFPPSGQEKMYDVIMETIEQDLPSFIGNIFTYATNPGLILPAVLLMVWVSVKCPINQTCICEWKANSELKYHSMHCRGKETPKDLEKTW